jgi:hypothetical protein
MFAIVTEFLNRLFVLQDTFGGFVVELLLAALIYLHYRKFRTSQFSQQSFGPVLPFVALTTFLIIAVIKSSFTLSLGLVGALSIVRFRTPIKDPNELVYIFLAIASGVGTASGQHLLTLIVVILILAIMALMRQTLRIKSENVFLSVDVSGVTDAEAAFTAVSSIVRANATRSSFIRYEMHDSVFHLTAETELQEPEAMPRITDQIRQRYPSTNVSFYDDSNLPTP